MESNGWRWSQVCDIHGQGKIGREDYGSVADGRMVLIKTGFMNV